MYIKITAVLLILTLIGCDQKDYVQDLPCEYFFNEFHIESTDVTKYKSFTVFLNFLNDKTDGNLYFVSYDLSHFNMEINLEYSLCIDSSTKVRFFFNDGTTSEYFSIKENNCNGELTIQISDLTFFKTKIIEKIQILNLDEFICFDLDEKTQAKYEKMSGCFFKIVVEKNLNRKNNLF